MKKLFISLGFVILVAAACTSTNAETPLPDKTSPPTDEIPAPTTPPPTEDVIADESIPFVLTSPEFVNEEAIPAKFSCDGEDIPPLLEWTDPPDGTQSFALIMDDPDAPGGLWVHWVLFNIPLDARSLSEAVPTGPTLEDGSSHGRNGWGKMEYGGPCPPSGTHRYFFKLYALDTIIEADPGRSNTQLLDLMDGHILAETQLMGVYSR